MLLVKKLPWASLLLLVFTYAVFGWLISVPDFSWLIWLSGAVYVLLITTALTAPLSLIRNLYSGWLKSDTRALISVILGAFVAVIILCWLRVFIRILVLLAAGALVRLDLQTVGCRGWNAFTILTVASLTGFSLGVIMHYIL